MSAWKALLIVGKTHAPYVIAGPTMSSAVNLGTATSTASVLPVFLRTMPRADGVHVIVFVVGSAADARFTGGPPPSLNGQNPTSPRASGCVASIIAPRGGFEMVGQPSANIHCPLRRSGCWLSRT